MSKKPKCSLKPQHVNSMVWYYERKGGIELIIDVPELRRRSMENSVYMCCVPKRKLAASLRRMGLTKRERGARR